MLSILFLSLGAFVPLNNIPTRCRHTRPRAPGTLLLQHEEQMIAAARIARDIGVTARVLLDGTVEFSPLSASAAAQIDSVPSAELLAEDAPVEIPDAITGGESDAVKAAAFLDLKRRAEDARRAALAEHVRQLDLEEQQQASQEEQPSSSVATGVDEEEETEQPPPQPIEDDGGVFEHTGNDVIAQKWQAIALQEAAKVAKSVPRPSS